MLMDTDLADRHKEHHHRVADLDILVHLAASIHPGAAVDMELDTELDMELEAELHKEPGDTADRSSAGPVDALGMYATYQVGNLALQNAVGAEIARYYRSQNQEFSGAIPAN
jgi:hypothetical protein